MEMQQLAEEFVRLTVERNDVTKASRLLEEHPELVDADFASALAAGSYSGIPEWLKKNGPNDPISPLNWTALEYLCYSPFNGEGKAEAVSLLLEAGADPNSSHPFGQDEGSLSALYGATCISCNREVARMLLEKGANPNDGESVYHSAQLALEPMLELLLEHGAEISAADKHWGNTPLYFLAGHRATDSGYQRALVGIRWLLEHGADPNVTCGKNEEAPLHVSCRLRTNELTELLLKHGADPMLRDNRGLTPYYWALIMGNQAAVEMLQQRGAGGEVVPPVAYVSACSFGKGEEAQKLLRAHGDEITYNLRRFPGVLPMLAENGIASGVEGVLDAGLEVNSCGSAGATALHFAGYCGWPKVARLLLARGASLKLRDSSYNATPTGWALEGYFWNRNASGDYLEVLRSLVIAGANPDEIREYCGTVEGRTDDVDAVLSLLRS